MIENGDIPLEKESWSDRSSGCLFPVNGITQSKQYYVNPNGTKGVKSII